MTTALMIAPAGALDAVRPVVPALVADAGEAAAVRFFDFFTARRAACAAGHRVTGGVNRLKITAPRRHRAGRRAFPA